MTFDGRFTSLRFDDAAGYESAVLAGQVRVGQWCHVGGERWRYGGIDDAGIVTYKGAVAAGVAVRHLLRGPVADRQADALVVGCKARRAGRGTACRRCDLRWPGQTFSLDQCPDRRPTIPPIRGRLAARTFPPVDRK